MDYCPHSTRVSSQSFLDSQRNTTPENKVNWLLVAFVPVFGPLLHLMFGERRLSKKRNQNNLKKLALCISQEANRPATK